jgi:hypothetical protein
MRRALTVAVVVCLASVGAQAAATLPLGRPACGLQPPGGQWSGAAQWIAGLSDSAFSAGLTEEQHAAWNDFSKHSNTDWSRLRKQYLDRIEDWRSRNLPNAGSRLAFYPFGGPDAINLLTFFPDARDYVMLGLEPVGCVPGYIADYTSDYFTDLRRGLNDVVAMGFFITEDLRRNVTHTELKGVLPLLLFLVSRAGYTVNSVTPIAISPEGISGPWASLAGHETPGIAIQFSDSRHRTRTLSYYSIDLTDGALRRRPGSAKYLKSLPESVTLVKAASYLMHHPNFSTIRDMILSQSRIVLEEDSGIPYRFFTPDAWRVRLFGSYAQPIQLFRRWVQPDLKAAYADDAVQPLDFALGYQHKGQANLLLAFRK